VCAHMSYVWVGTGSTAAERLARYGLHALSSRGEGEAFFVDRTGTSSSHLSTAIRFLPRPPPRSRLWRASSQAAGSDVTLGALGVVAGRLEVSALELESPASLHMDWCVSAWRDTLGVVCRCSMLDRFGWLMGCV
jgi:hypothetical protein